ncbi:hypothetical protein CsSME_00040917 [Camellia sinensis var. sinensis]
MMTHFSKPPLQATCKFPQTPTVALTLLHHATLHSLQIFSLSLSLSLYICMHLHIRN